MDMVGLSLCDDADGGSGRTLTALLREHRIGSAFGPTSVLALARCEPSDERLCGRACSLGSFVFVRESYFFLLILDLSCTFLSFNLYIL